MESKSTISKYKEQICDITKDPEFSNKKFAYGFTSTVYKLGNSVIKETYLSKEELEQGDFFEEIKANIFFREHPELQQYAIKFEGFEFCDDKIYTKYEYVGNPLSETILDYTPKELTIILNKVLENAKKLHKYIIHGDLHIGNIFINKNKDGKIEEVVFGDWGRAVIKGKTARILPENLRVEISEEIDIKRFLESFKLRLEMSYFFKNINTKYALKLLDNKGKKKQFFNTLNFRMANRKKKYPHRPADFIEKMRPFFFNDLLFEMIKREYSDNFVIQKCKFSPEMKKIIEKIKNKIEDNKTLDKI